MLFLSTRIKPGLWSYARQSGSRYYGTRTFDPLRILFFGSDNFSIASLNTLHETSLKEPKLIESIHVVARPGKWSGPYKKVFKEAPIVEQARALKLPLHLADTLRGWNPPADSNYNLILAVSFGLLIPRRLIEGAKYGGLNVHPSLLPDLWGPAPLQHALLDDDERIGLTIQTLHPTTMDRGAILAQSTINPPEAARESFSSLVNHTAPLGAELLLSSLRQGLFVSPTTHLTNPTAIASMNGTQPRHARKLTLEDRHIDWTTWPADKIILRQRLLKTLWNTVAGSNAPPRKIVWSGRFERVERSASGSIFPVGLPYGDPEESSDIDGSVTLVNTVDGSAVAVRECTVAGDKKSSIETSARKYGLWETDGSKVRCFAAPLR